MTRILVLNSGSSSLRYRLYADLAPAPGRSSPPGESPPPGDGAAGVPGGTVLAGGVVQRIGEAGGGPADHATALRVVMDGLDLTGLVAVGHRVVHGGLRFAEPTLIDDGVVREITKLIPLAPLHNPANLTGIEVARRLLSGVPQVAVFDTAFHRTLPEAAARYAIDRQTADEYGIRRYGFHGTSHSWVSRRTAALLDRPYAATNLISLHLGNGASACAVQGGRSVATSMGMSPLEGLVMGTRSGDLDPAVLLHLQRFGGRSVDELDHLLNHRSGLAGLCGANDMREVLRRRADGDPAADLAFEIYCRRIRGYVGAYYALLGRVDAVTFTAGVGENAAPVRAAALAGLDRLGIAVDPERNAAHGDRVISVPGAEVAVCVIATDEELEIARQTHDLVAGSPSGPPSGSASGSVPASGSGSGSGSAEREPERQGEHQQRREPDPDQERRP